MNDDAVHLVNRMQARIDGKPIADADRKRKPSPIEAAKDGHPYARTDYGNAERLTAHFSDRVRHCKALGWFTWDKKRWKQDETNEIERFAKQAVRLIYREAEAAAKAEDGLAEKLAKHEKASESYNRLTAMIRLTQSEPTVAIAPDALDSHDWLFNTRTGTLDLRTGQQYPHRPADLLTLLAPVDYVPDAPCPLWDRHLATIFNNDRELIQYVQRCLGMALTADISEQTLQIWHGVGQNGKNTTLDTIREILGPYASDAPPHLLTMRKTDEHPTEIADLFGKRLVIGSETEEGARLRIQLVKRLTGDAYLKGRYMKKDYFEFRRTFKLILITNNKPRVTEDTKAVWRRIKLVPFDVIIPDDQRDLKLGAKLRDELPGILAWMVRGCLDWQTLGLPEPHAVARATEGYRQESDPLRDFLIEYCVVTTNAWVESKRLFDAYKSFGAGRGEPTLSARTFGARLGRLGFRPGKKSERRGWHGLGLLDNRPPDTSDTSDRTSRLDTYDGPRVGANRNNLSDVSDVSEISPGAIKNAVCEGVETPSNPSDSSVRERVKV